MQQNQHTYGGIRRATPWLSGAACGPLMRPTGRILCTRAIRVLTSENGHKKGGCWWWQKGWVPVDVFSTGWRQELYKFPYFPSTPLPSPPILLLSERDVVKDVKEDAWRGRVSGKLANPGSRGRMVIKPVNLWYSGVMLRDWFTVSVCRSDGVRQSGLYVAMSCVWERLKDHQEVDIFQAVRELRYHRPQIIHDMVSYQQRLCVVISRTYMLLKSPC